MAQHLHTVTAKGACKALNSTKDTKMIKLYKNLNKGCWSIKDNASPVTHADALTAHRVVFKVSETRRQVVIAKKCREVHAWAIAETTSKASGLAQGDIEITYNPYRGPDFTTRDGKAVVSCETLILHTDGKIYGRKVKFK